MAPRVRSRPPRSSAVTDRSTRHAKPTISYRESSSDAKSPSDAENGSGSEVEIVKVRNKRSRNSGSAPQKRQQRSSPRPARSNNSEILYEESPRNRSGPPVRYIKFRKPQVVIHSRKDPGVIPPWTTLPYQTWIDIFRYAATPLYNDKTFQQEQSWSWLRKASRICRAFTEPALTVLYQTPCLVPMDKAHKLCDLLRQDPASLAYNYRWKIERLQMDVQQTAAYTQPGYGLLDLHNLVYYCPRLLDLELYNQKEMAPYRMLHESIKWNYPESLFTALAQNIDGGPTKLRSWRWSSKMATRIRPIETLLETHKTAPFSYIRKLAFVNYQVPIVKKKDIEENNVLDYETLLAESLTPLRQLDHLIFEACGLLNSKLLSLLPRNLKHLEIIACPNVTSENLSEFLSTHGSEMRTLALNHNQSLSLSFLTILAAACPNLTNLHTNLIYYNAHHTFRDCEPGYANLLSADEIPTWPSTLQTIELSQLRNWEGDVAETFFNSLLNSAGELPDLRFLSIKAILDRIDWRDRAPLRIKYEKAFERVFKRKSEPPNPHFTNIKEAKKWLDEKREEKQNPRSKPKAESDSDDEPLITLVQHKGSSSKPIHGTQKAEPETTKRILRSAIKPPPPRRRVLKRIRDSSSSSPASGSHSDSNSEVEADSESEMDTEDEATRLRKEKEARRRTRALREIETLKQTSGFHGRRSRNTSHARSVIDVTDTENLDENAGLVGAEEQDSDDEPLALRRPHAKSEAETWPTREQKRKQIIQGLVTTLEFRLDSLRPSEMQFREEDFVDSEPEGDMDYVEGREYEEDDGGGYAWR